MSAATQARTQDEATGADPELMAKFAEEHGGMTPLQLALSKFPLTPAKAKRR